MTTTDRRHVDKRLIEHYLPIERISTEARREKSVRKGHISTLHLYSGRVVRSSPPAPPCLAR